MANKKTSFGGDWTEAKLNKLKEYLVAYTTALKKQDFVLIYIDAFAGTGFREVPVQESGEAELFPEFSANDESRPVFDGSARIALKLDRPFDEYIFIELSRRRFSELTKIKEEFKDLSERIKLVREDCNQYLKKFCSKCNWGKCRAVLFLDPFGMQVEWSTIEAIAATKAIDVWILFPIGSVNRTLKKDGWIPASWRSALTRFWGTEEWFEEFYEEFTTLMETESCHIKKATFEKIKRYYLERLRSLFAGVADNPLPLKNSKGSLLYLLCFAAANPRGAEIAVRIAQHILKKG